MDEIYWIWLTLLKGVGPVTAHKLIREYGIAEYIYQNREEIFRCNEGIDLTPYSLDEAQKIYEECKKQKIYVISYDSQYYDIRWKQWDDFPVLLYLKGNPVILKEKAIGIVGPRRCTSSAKEKTITLASDAVKNHKAVVSGMAKGVDAYAHTAAIKTGGNTIAVLGSGVNLCYPREHQRLYEVICENGAVISEYRPDIPPRQYNFPRRNRIIAGLSDIVYVVEAGEKSGTRATIQAAKNYGKKVVAW